MKNRWIASLLALSVLLSAGCGLIARTEDVPAPLEEKERPAQPNMAIHAVAGQEDTDFPEFPEEEPEEIPEEPEEPEEPELVWCTDPVLTEEEMPGSYRGLELPVDGATGYTSTSLPLWASLEDWEVFQQAVSDWEEYQAAVAAAEEAARALAEEAAQALAPDNQPRSEDGEGAVPAPVDNIQTLSAQEAPGAGEEPSLPPDDGEDAPPQEGEENPQLPEGETDAPPAGEGDVPLPAGEGEIPPSVDGEDVPLPVDELPPSDGETEPVPEGDLPQGPDEGSPAEPETADPSEFLESVLSELGEPPEEPVLANAALAVLPAGTAMTVLREEGNWWLVRCEAEYFTGDGGTAVGEAVGWVAHRCCMINLPDVIPSIVYNATNAYSSMFRTCGKEIDGITGVQLYSGPTNNQRLGDVEFMMPVLYSMAPRLCAAQRAALREGNTLVLYEGYRPKETQLKVAGAVQRMMNNEPEIRTALNTKPWSVPWFIATSTSNHQWGYAVDVTLARVSSVQVCRTGDYAFTRVAEYEEYKMPTLIHELSPAAAIFTQAIGPNSKTAWKSATRTESFAASESALGLQAYCTGAGLSPLASEWWHFNDLDSRANVLDNLGKGDFEITVCRSEAPW